MAVLSDGIVVHGQLAGLAEIAILPNSHKITHLGDCKCQ
jgi:hypothetical protein